MENYRIPELSPLVFLKLIFLELFSGFSEVKISLKKTYVSTSFTGPLQVVKKLPIWQIVFLSLNLVTAHDVS